MPRLSPAHYLWFILLGLLCFGGVLWLTRPAEPPAPLPQLQAWQAPLLQPLAAGQLPLRRLSETLPGTLWLVPRLDGLRLVYRSKTPAWSAEAELQLSAPQRDSLHKAMAVTPNSPEQPLSEVLAEELGEQPIAELRLTPLESAPDMAQVQATFGAPRLRLELAEGEAWVYPEQGLTVHWREGQLALMHVAPRSALAR